MHAQATGAEQISETLTQLSEAAQQTAESLRQSNLAIEQLNGAARGLQASVARFKLSSHSPRALAVDIYGTAI
jgi:methyl-accepting chemotaxis protein WspA